MKKFNELKHKLKTFKDIGNNFKKLKEIKHNN